MHAKALPAIARARLLEQLFVLENAGVPALQAFTQLYFPPAFQTRVKMAKTALAKGQPLATAAGQAGLLTAFERRVIAAASSAGSPVAAYQSLAVRARREHARGSVLIIRLLMPLALLGAVLLILPLPGVFSGTLSVAQYLSQNISVLGVIGMMIYLLMHLNRVAMMKEAGSWLPLDAFVLRIPWLGRLIRRDSLQQFADTLSLMLAAGIPMQSALPDAAQTVRWSSVRAVLLRWQSQLLSGSTLQNAAAMYPVEDGEALLAAIAAGEGAGDLARSLAHFAALTASEVESDKQLLSDWIPRVVYLLIVLAAAYAIVGGVGVLISRDAG